MWSLVALDRWSSYTATIIWEFAWVDSALVVLDEWLFYRGGRLNRFHCVHINTYINKMEPFLTMVMTSSC